MATKLCDKYDIKDRVEIVADVGTSVATLPTHFAVGSKAYIGSQAYMLNASNTWVEDNTGGGGGGGGGGGTDTNAVHYTADANKTAEQKAQARTNIGAGTSSFSGDYNDLTNKPTIPDLTLYRTSADQDIIDNALDARLDDVEEVIPSQATSSNQLADKDFVNSSIGTNTAYYISNNGQPFNSVAELQAYSGTVTNNDYAFVTGTDEHGNTYFDRYKATVSGSTVTWAKEYRLNNSSFTAAQWAAISSGITSGLVALISTALQPSALNAYRTSSAQDTIDNGKEATSNKVTSLSSASTDTQYPSAKCVYDLVGNIEATLNAIRGV